MECCKHACWQPTLVHRVTSLRVVVTGGSGVLACALRDLRPRWTYLAHTECDVRSAGAVHRTLHALRPDVVLHTAALTDHQHPNAADVIETNIEGTRLVALAARQLDITMVYTSSHYVYPGVRGGYTEFDATQPIGAYAWSKLVGEQWVETLLRPSERALIVRGSWYTRETRLDRWAKRGALTDAWCSREPVEDAARKIVALTEAGVRGTVNIGGARRTFFEILLDEGYIGFRPVRRADFGDLPYAFPADVSVSTALFDGLGLKLP